MQTLVPLWPDRRLSAETVAHRVGVFCAGDGMPALAATCLDVAVERCTTMFALIRHRGTLGDDHFARLLSDGHDVIWEAGAHHAAANGAEWKHLLAGRGASPGARDR